MKRTGLMAQTRANVKPNTNPKMLEYTQLTKRKKTQPYIAKSLLLLLVEQSGLEPPTSTVRGMYSSTISNNHK